MTDNGLRNLLIDLSDALINAVEAIDERDELLAEGKKSLGNPNRWIPVEKALPEEWESVLVTDEDDEVLVAEWRKNYDDTITWWGYDLLVFPKAWMPLPERYKESPTGQEVEE